MGKEGNMRKLRLEIIKSMLEARLTSSQIDLFIFASRIQEDDGTVPGIYYDDICKAINITKPTFYKTLRILKEKNIIDYEKEDYYDYKIKILNNDFTNREHSNYLSTRYEVLDSEDFYSLKANEKLMFLDLLKNAAASMKKTNDNSNVISREKFYEKYMKILDVKNTRTIDRYISNLKKFFYFKHEGKNLRIGVKVKAIKEFDLKEQTNITTENKSSFKYVEDNIPEFPSFEVSTNEVEKIIKNYNKNKKATIERMNKLKEEDESTSDLNAYTYHLVKKIMRRNKIKYAEDKQIKEVAKLLYQHKNEKPDYTIQDFWNTLCNAVTDTIYLTNTKDIPKKQWVRKLDPAFIHDRFIKLLNKQAA